jgi:hypothetical protein
MWQHFFNPSTFEVQEMNAIEMFGMVGILAVYATCITFMLNIPNSEKPKDLKKVGGEE